jgi:hypothetical protein
MSKLYQDLENATKNNKALIHYVQANGQRYTLMSEQILSHSIILPRNRTMVQGGAMCYN